MQLDCSGFPWSTILQMLRLTLAAFPTLLRRLATQTERMSKRRTEASSSVLFQPASKRQRFTANADTSPEDVEVKLDSFGTGRAITFTFPGQHKSEGFEGVPVRGVSSMHGTEGLY